MSVYIRKGLAHIPGPSDSDQSEDDEDSFLKDPDQLQDQLPQPFRMIDKVLNRILDMAWDIIRESESERESAEKAEQSNKTVPVLQLEGKFKLPERTNCLVCSDDGRYIFMGHSQGLSVCTTCSLVCVSAWLEDRLEITSIHITGLGETAYLVGTIDDMGVARLYTFHTDIINLLKVFNEAEDLNQRSLCMKFELSKGGDFGALSISCNGAQCLEVYRFPKELWLKELKEQTASQKQHPSGIGDVKLMPVSLLLKIKPPKIPTGAIIKSPFEVLQKTEEGSIFGSGQNHLVSSRQWEDQDALFRSKYRKYLITNFNKTKVTEEKPSHCTSHFLLPGGLFPVLGGAKSQPGVPVSVCMWWIGSHNLHQYLLCKPAKDKPDIEPKPDVLWPNAHEILCSGVSSCTRYVALGLTTNLVSVWDRHFVSADSALSRMMFVDYRPAIPDDVLLSQGPANTKVYILVTCHSGTRLVLTIGQGANSYAVKLLERHAETGSLPTSTAPVPFTQGLVLLMYRDGKMLLRDVINKTTVCRFSIPDTHLLATPWDPVYALDSTQQTLFIRGDQNLGHCEYVEADDRESQLFVLRISESVLLEPYRVAPKESQKAQTGTNFSNLEEAFNHYVQQRVLCVNERNTAMTQTWNQLQQHAATVLQSNQRHGNTTTS
ncbi:WD repeat-containing protein 93 [Aplochiton taeniatus]